MLLLACTVEVHSEFVLHVNNFGFLFHFLVIYCVIFFSVTVSVGRRWVWSWLWWFVVRTAGGGWSVWPWQHSNVWASATQERRWRPAFQCRALFVSYVSIPQLCACCEVQKIIGCGRKNGKCNGGDDIGLTLAYCTLFSFWHKTVKCCVFWWDWAIFSVSLGLYCCLVDLLASFDVGMFAALLFMMWQSWSAWVGGHSTNNWVWAVLE